MEDFGDGGAFPEIHVAQYPRHMARPGGPPTSSSTALSISMNGQGRANHEAVVTQGGRGEKHVHAKFTDLIPKPNQASQSLALPSKEDLDETARDTQAALDKILNKKSTSVHDKVFAKTGQTTKVELIRYTPAQTSTAHASGAGERLIQMHEAIEDPLNPPKFKVKKVRRGGGSPPVPVMHSPPRAASKDEKEAWVIPPCVSNYKNPKGYVIPLDKRLAADGRGLQSFLVSDKFAKFQEALSISDQKSREAIAMRNQIRQELAKREKDDKERHLRELAQQARADRLGESDSMAHMPPPPRNENMREAYPGPPPPPSRPHAGRTEVTASVGHHGSPSESFPPPPSRGAERVRGVEEDEYRGDRYRETREEREERLKRDEIREERRRERERERRLEQAGEHGRKKSKVREIWWLLGTVTIPEKRDRDEEKKVPGGAVRCGVGRKGRGGETLLLSSPPYFAFTCSLVGCYVYLVLMNTLYVVICAGDAGPGTRRIGASGAGYGRGPFRPAARRGHVRRASLQSGTGHWRDRSGGGRRVQFVRQALVCG